MAPEDWIRYAVWWQVYPLGFTGAPAGPPVRAPRPRTGCGASSWLDYAAGLGATGIALGPVFAAHTHGYDTVDHFRIDPRLGDEDDFLALVAAARSRGLRVLLDGVFNHVGRGFPAFAAVLEQGPAAPTASWFDLTWPAGAGPGTEPGYRTFEGHGELVALNHAEPAVATYVTEVMTHWLDRGADGWRLDAAYAVPPVFWSRVLPAGAGARTRTPTWSARSSTATTPRSWPRPGWTRSPSTSCGRRSGARSTTATSSSWPGRWTGTTSSCASFAPLTFVGNHDVTRIASRLHRAEHLPHALAVLFTVGGTPSVYYGDEQAFRGVKEDRAGGDDAIRPAFPGAPAGLAPWLGHLPAASAAHRPAPGEPLAAPGPHRACSA